MTATAPMRTAGGPRLLIKKSIDQVQREAGSHSLKRTLGPINLVMLGIGCIIGAGIYVITGSAAANYAGPAVLLSFVVAGLACAFAGLCYAELASTMPVAGSAYTYSYTTLGEVFAWIMGWLLVLEYGVAAAVVAAGWSGNVVSLFHQFGADIPAAMSTPFINGVTPPEGGALVFQTGSGFNLVGALGILAVTALLVIGISESAKVNNVIVFIKVGILLLFIGMGVAFINADNYTPFIPANEGGFKYGWAGILRGASVVFFAYVGFEAVSTAAAEAKNPAKDIPVGILGSLAVCTIIYMATAAVLTGIVPFRELGVPAPVALAVDRMGLPWFSVLIKVGTIAGLSSVMLILTYGQSRIFYAMARDGLLPRAFARLHPKFRTPWIGTIILGGLIALSAGALPITILGDLTSIGTACAFGIVCLSTLRLRRTRPDLVRPFRAPGGRVVPWLGIAFAALMVIPVLADILGKAANGDAIPAVALGVFLIVGALIYMFYGVKHSRLAKGQDVLEDDAGVTPLDALRHGVTDGNA